jgi:D-glycero-D-manno-heptose 1,7-bisphosphate phosphatase
MGLVIFDLDGTLTPQRPSSTAAFDRQFCGGVPERCRELLAAGHTLAVASNQGGIAKGLSVEAVEAHLRWVCSELGMSAYRFASERVRKKPAPAMLLEMMDQFSASPADTWLVGDSEDDERAAVAAGVRFVHVTAFVASGLG